MLREKLESSERRLAEAERALAEAREDLARAAARVDTLVAENERLQAIVSRMTESITERARAYVPLIIAIAVMVGVLAAGIAFAGR